MEFGLVQGNPENSTHQISDYKRRKLEQEAQKNWDRFYRRNSANFFKDRNWTKGELQVLCPDLRLDDRLIFIEAGCGCGNTILPLLSFFPSWDIYGIDFSTNAINLLEERAKKHGLIVETRIADLTEANLGLDLPRADLISLIFVLSSIAKDLQKAVVQNLYRMLKAGGSVLFRDYGADDHAMTRFGRGSRISERFYARQDGTRAYFFLLEETRTLFEECGFKTAYCEYIRRRTENVKERISIERIFVQGRFIRTD